MERVQNQSEIMSTSSVCKENEIKTTDDDLRWRMTAFGLPNVVTQQESSWGVPEKFACGSFCDTGGNSREATWELFLSITRDELFFTKIEPRICGVGLIPTPEKQRSSREEEM